MQNLLTLDALRVLDAIDRKQSFAAAADELFRVPSAISYTINKLEEDLGVALFDRSKRKAEFTQVGQLILQQGRAILKASDELTHMAKQAASGWELELRICMDSILHYQAIYDLINLFQQSYPWIDIRLTQENFGGTWDSLSAGETDLIIGASDEPYTNDFDTHPLGLAEFIFAIAKDHPLSLEPEPLTSDKIKQYPSIVAMDSSRYLPPRSAGLLDGQARITVPDLQKKIDAQRFGLGVGYLPLHRIQDYLQSGELISPRLENAEARQHQLCIAWRKDNHGKALAWFVEKLKEMQLTRFLNY
ncbi:MAG: LysR substrate-binding domain-containing protein [Marinomonas sp.]|uniref:LysR substrate-binding domain-containing protein n=1 Tax=unclassified Marinomonas TaxID=196814 RepID=UPI0007AEEC79|nr:MULTISPECIES: LysR substrate-binding domain-containing protein [unclassified Marinomonas]KZM38759.1 LysR family transcriptional regulator [Marinomonas sp. SBI8L]KZM43777.1 LysR family transcriptional regulator [Marinomonas sp. SBI22]